MGLPRWDLPKSADTLEQMPAVPVAAIWSARAIRSMVLF
jgi:hypothetical protein